MMMRVGLPFPVCCSGVKFKMFNVNLLPPESPVTPAKRKAAGTKETPPAKKAKSDGEGEDAQAILYWLHFAFYFNLTKLLNMHFSKQVSFVCFINT